jgi:hypothetical protein
MIFLRRTLLLLTALAMLLGSTAFLAHQHRSDVQMGQAAAEQCELCLQWQRVSGPAVLPQQALRTVTWTCDLDLTGTPQLSGYRLLRAHPARGPPLQA